ncbi:MAG: hypothetical protein GY827_04145 [Cytophagales bacterium]|nr:hypothetical protein [Cytophagales bacterium]
MPTFDIPEGEGIDEEKVERFIQHSASIGKSIEEIEVAYNKGLESGAFNKQVQPKRESSFEKAIEKTAEKDPSFMDKLMSAP